MNDADGVTIRKVRAEWTGGPGEKNGSYGIYPVKCKNVLIEDSASSGAADAGIYVGQSKNIIVRRSRAEYNVAGMRTRKIRRVPVVGEGGKLEGILCLSDLILYARHEDGTRPDLSYEDVMGVLKSIYCHDSVMVLTG